MRLNSTPFELIKAGKKTIEIRVFDKKRQQVKVGDQIVFKKLPHEVEELTTTVAGISLFNTFKELFLAINKEKFGYDNDATLEQQLHEIWQIYSQEEEKEYGVVGIHIKLA